VVSVNVITTALKMCAFRVIMSSKNRKLLTCTLNQCRVSMRMMMCIGPPSYTLLAQFYYDLLLQGYMFRLLRVIIRASNELTQDYLIPSALGIRQSWVVSLEGLMMTLRSRNM